MTDGEKILDLEKKLKVLISAIEANTSKLAFSEGGLWFLPIIKDGERLKMPLSSNDSEQISGVKCLLYEALLISKK